MRRRAAERMLRRRILDDTDGNRGSRSTRCGACRETGIAVHLEAQTICANRASGPAGSKRLISWIFNAEVDEMLERCASKWI